MQVAFILAGSTHTTYCKTLQDIAKCSGYETIGKMHPVVLCEVAKREMKEKSDGDLGSWKRAVTTDDQTWGWPHSLLDIICSVLPPPLPEGQG